ncbi:MAG: hypothetical protein ABIV39_04165 [Verrucomicrobiota bacterium]
MLKCHRDNLLPVLMRTPKFEDSANEYFRFSEQAKDTKRLSTIKTEQVAIRHWKKQLGHVRIHSGSSSLLLKS